MEDCVTAVVTDNLAYDTSYQPFERPPDHQTLYSLIPRGLRRIFLATDVSAKPVNDQIDLFITATLPVNFAYIMTRFNLQLAGDTAGQWSTRVQLRMSNHINGQPVGTTEQVHVATNTFTPASANPTATVTAESAAEAVKSFAGPVWAVPGGAILFRVAMTNINADVGAAAFVITHAEFLEYDLTQAQRYWINTPYPVMQR